MLEQGPTEEKIIAEATRRGLPLPQSIQNAPRLFLGLEMFLNGFFDLNNSRQLGMSLGPIAWHTIQEYCIHLGLDADEAEDMHYHVSKLDGIWLKWQQAKTKS